MRGLNVSELFSTATIFNADRLGNILAKRYFHTTINDERPDLSDPTAAFNEVFYVYDWEIKNGNYPEGGLVISFGWSNNKNTVRSQIGVEFLMGYTGKFYFRRVSDSYNGNTSDWKRIAIVE